MRCSESEYAVRPPDGDKLDMMMFHVAKGDLLKHTKIPTAVVDVDTDVVLQSCCMGGQHWQVSGLEVRTGWGGY